MLPGGWLACHQICLKEVLKWTARGTQPVTAIVRTMQPNPIYNCPMSCSFWKIVLIAVRLDRTKAPGRRQAAHLIWRLTAAAVAASVTGQRRTTWWRGQPERKARAVEIKVCSLTCMAICPARSGPARGMPSVFRRRFATDKLGAGRAVFWRVQTQKSQTTLCWRIGFFCSQGATC